MVGEGYTYDEAVAFCKKYGLTIKANYVETSAYEEGKVISQSLRKGSDVVEGSTLTVDVAAKPTEKKDTTKSDSTPSDSSGSSGSPTGDKEKSGE